MFRFVSKIPVNIKNVLIHFKYFLISLSLFSISFTSFAQTIEEVTVTAARQEQSVQDVAISVQAITSDELQDQHIETADDLLTHLLEIA